MTHLISKLYPLALIVLVVQPESSSKPVRGLDLLGLLLVVLHLILQELLLLLHHLLVIQEVSLRLGQSLSINQHSSLLYHLTVSNSIWTEVP